MAFVIAVLFFSSLWDRFRDRFSDQISHYLWLFGVVFIGPFLCYWLHAAFFGTAKPELNEEASGPGRY